MYYINIYAYIHMVYTTSLKNFFMKLSRAFFTGRLFFIQENPPVINEIIFPLHQFYPAIFYKTNSRFISLEKASLMLPSKNKLFFDSCPFIPSVFMHTPSSQVSRNFKAGGDFFPRSHSMYLPNPKFSLHSKTGSMRSPSKE